MPDVIADTSALQYLHRLALLDVLHQYYGTIAVPEAVVREIESGAALGADVPDSGSRFASRVFSESC